MARGARRVSPSVPRSVAPGRATTDASRHWLRRAERSARSRETILRGVTRLGLMPRRSNAARHASAIRRWTSSRKWRRSRRFFVREVGYTGSLVGSTRRPMEGAMFSVGASRAVESPSADVDVCRTARCRGRPSTVHTAAEGVLAPTLLDRVIAGHCAGRKIHGRRRSRPLMPHGAGEACLRRPVRRTPREYHRGAAALFRLVRSIAEIVHEVGPHRAGASTGPGTVLRALDDFAHVDPLSPAHFFQGVPEFRLQAHTGPTASDHDIAGDQPTT